MNEKELPLEQNNSRASIYELCKLELSRKQCEQKCDEMNEDDINNLFDCYFYELYSHYHDLDKNHTTQQIVSNIADYFYDEIVGMKKGTNRGGSTFKIT